MTRRSQRQLGLLEARPTLPAWKGLPPECREEVLRILERMLMESVDHSRGGRVGVEIDDE